ncbi:hypothetical protein STEG23_037025, partial [Scotinomys teguina]
REDVILEWIFLPHKPNKKLKTYIEKISDLIHKGYAEHKRRQLLNFVKTRYRNMNQYDLSSAALRASTEGVTGTGRLRTQVGVLRAQMKAAYSLSSPQANTKNLRDMMANETTWNWQVRVQQEVQKSLWSGMRKEWEKQENGNINKKESYTLYIKEYYKTWTTVNLKPKGVLCSGQKPMERCITSHRADNRDCLTPDRTSILNPLHQGLEHQRM